MASASTTYNILEAGRSQYYYFIYILDERRTTDIYGFQVKLQVGHGVKWDDKWDNTFVLAPVKNGSWTTPSEERVVCKSFAAPPNGVMAYQLRKVFRTPVSYNTSLLILFPQLSCGIDRQLILEARHHIYIGM